MERQDDGKFGSKRELEEYKQLFDDYAGWLTDFVDKDTTITRRKKGAEAWLHWCAEEGYDPLDADEETVDAFVHAMVGDGLAETTISNRFASVSKFYHWISTDPDRPNDVENPTAEITLPNQYDISNNAAYTRILHREGREDIIAPDYEELKPLFDHPPGATDFSKIRNELVCRLFWQTALRSDEMSRVRLDNIDFDDRDIRVRSAKLNIDDHPNLYHRHVFYEDNLDYLMQRWIDKRAEKDPKNESPYLFIGGKGNQLSSSYLSRIVKEAAHDAGIQEPLVRDSDGTVAQWLYTAHRLRHSRITHLANKTDMDLNFVRMMAGHASMDTTLDYVNPDWGEARQAYRDATGTGN